MRTIAVKSAISDIATISKSLKSASANSTFGELLSQQASADVLAVVGADDNLPLTPQNIAAIEARLSALKGNILRAACAVALITVRGRPTGTGFLLNDGTFVTALHVIDSEATAAHARIFFVRLTDECEHSGHTECRVRPNSFRAMPPEDWSSMAIEPCVAGASLPIGLRASVNANLDRVVTIHRRRGRLELSAKWERCTADSEGYEVTYPLDTQGGSSGAPVLNEQWEVEAVHSGVREVGKSNDGTRIARVARIETAERTSTLTPPSHSPREQIFPGWYAIKQSGVEVGRLWAEPGAEVWFQFTAGGTQLNGVPYAPFVDFTPKFPETLSYSIEHQGFEGYFADIMLSNSSPNQVVMEEVLPALQRRSWTLTTPSLPSSLLDGIQGVVYQVKQNGVWCAIFALSNDKTVARWWLFTKNSSIGAYNKFVWLEDSTPTSHRLVEFISVGDGSSLPDWSASSPEFIAMALNP